MPAVKLLFVGCGFTAAAIRFYLDRLALAANQVPLLQQVEVHGWEVAPLIGGRMLSHRSKETSRLTNLGAQYLTEFLAEVDSDVLTFLQEQGAIQSFDPKTGVIQGIRPEHATLPHFSTPLGSSAIVDALWHGSGQVQTRTNMHVQRILPSLASNIQEKVASKKLQVTAAAVQEGSQFEEEFDYIVVTVPTKDPLLSSLLSSSAIDQVNALYSTNKDFQEESIDPSQFQTAIGQVAYSSRLE